MRCNQCHQDQTKVIESRDVADNIAIRRRRVCTNCNHRFTTYERIEHPQIIVIKNDGTRELFSREKLLAGLNRASEKTTVTSLQLERLVNDIEQQLYASADLDIESSRIGEMVMTRLSLLNEVAYVRFASVYRRFQDIAGFEKELVKIKETKLDRANKDK
ncbi:MAG TPA: transcriptional regulator NrdR [Candidatus Saccharimonadales bacterium]|jgi:transcriptional repressor NrdR|nr:transcriptional regulator NrdR [Candidatus Saccharimonadales bacterium]